MPKVFNIGGREVQILTPDECPVVSGPIRLPGFAGEPPAFASFESGERYLGDLMVGKVWIRDVGTFAAMTPDNQLERATLQDAPPPLFHLWYDSTDPDLVCAVYLGELGTFTTTTTGKGLRRVDRPGSLFSFTEAQAWGRLADGG